MGHICIYCMFCIESLESKTDICLLYIQNRNFNYGVALTLWCLSPFIMVALAQVEKNWRMLHIWLGLLVSCLSPLFIFYQKESVRWLIITGKESKVENILANVSTFNIISLSSTSPRSGASLLLNMISG